MTSKLSFLLLTIPILTSAQSAGDGQVRTRQLWDTTLLDQRPSAKAPAAKPSAIKRPPATLVNGALVGITVWRLRPSKPADEPAVRTLIHGDSGDQELTPERVAASTPLAEGQKVRVSAEATQEGYLYIIDRDEYSDGGRSEPRLIFPTARTRGGNNRVSAGKVIEIPDRSDDPNYFNVMRTKPGQLAETLTLLIAPKKIEGLRIGDDPLPLSESQVAAWEKSAKSQVLKLEETGLAGKAYTAAERDAAAGTRSLAQGDPVPQTMYRVDAKPGDMVMVRVPLKIK